jgi:hypothetical protein
MSFFPTGVPTVNLLVVSDVVSALKVVSTRNNLVSRTSVNLGFETSASVLFSSGVSSTYAASTSISGTLSYPTALALQSRWTTVLTYNEGLTPGTTTINVNSGAYNVADEAILFSKTAGSGSPFKLCLFQVPIGFQYITSVTATFNKASSTTERNMQQVYILPGQWGAVSQSSAIGNTNSSLSTLANDIVFIAGGVSKTDSTPPAITHSGTSTNSRIIETSSTYGGNSGQIALHAINTSGTFLSNAGSVTIVTGGGAHATGTSTTYYYDTFSELLRFIQA